MPEIVILPLFILAGTLFFLLINPRSVPPAVLMIAFLIVLGILYSAVRLIFRVTGIDKRLKPMQYKGLMIASTLLPVILLALQSLGQLTLRDVTTLVILYAAGYFYVSRMPVSR